MMQTLQNDLPLWRHSGWTARATAGCWSTGIRGLLHEQPYCSGIVGARPLRTQRQGTTLPAGFRTRPDGRYTADDIVEEAAGEITPAAEVYYGLEAPSIGE